MSENEEARRVSGLIGGALLLLLGGVFILKNAGLVHAGRLEDYWPLLLVWVGLSRILGPRRSRHFASGVVVLLLGVFFQLNRLDILWIRARDFWPLLLVVVGAALIADSVLRQKRDRGGSPASAAGDSGGRS